MSGFSCLGFYGGMLRFMTEIFVVALDPGHNIGVAFVSKNGGARVS